MKHPAPHAFVDSADETDLAEIDASLDSVVVTLEYTSNPLDDQASRLRVIASPKVQPAAPAPAPVRPRMPAPVERKPASTPSTASPTRSAPMIAIASGKGGVGKTTLAVNLAIALSQRGLRITLLDADLGTANADLLCGLSPNARIEHVLAPDAAGAGRWADGAPRSLSDIAIEAPGGFRLVPGAAGVSRMANLSDQQRRSLVAALADIARDSDAVLIDTAAGVGHDVTAMMDAADLTLVVTTPEPTSIADAYALIKCAATSDQDAAWADLTPGKPSVAIVMNQVTGESEARAVHARIAAVAKRFLAVDCPLLGWIAHDLRVHEAVRARSPLLLRSPKTAASGDIAVLAAGLMRQLGLTPLGPEAKRPPRGLGALVQRLLGAPAGSSGPKKK